MNEVVRLALSFPGVVYTVLLGVVLVYWLFRGKVGDTGMYHH